MRSWLRQARNVAEAIYSGRTKSSAKLLLRLAALFCGVVGLYDLLTITLFLSGGPLIGPGRWVLFPDFLVFHAAARAFFEGKLAIIYDFGAFVEFENQIYSDRFPFYVDFRPFLYPPSWLLLILPLACLSVATAYGVFMTFTAAMATALIGRGDIWGWLAVLTSPAALWTMISGQNTFLSIGLFYGGMRLLVHSPAAAGILLGLLSYKPQLWVLIPVALLAARQWRVLGWAIGTAACVALASLAVFGLEFWVRFVEMAREASSPQIVNLMYRDVLRFLTTLLAAGRILALPPVLAGAIHVAGAAVAIVAVWLAFSRYSISEESTAVLAAGTLLVSPYLINYDLLLLMPAVVTTYRRRIARRLYPGEFLFYGALWLMPNVGLRLNDHKVPLMPIFVLMFGFLAWETLKATKPDRVSR